jgi:hypothetical protein
MSEAVKKPAVFIGSSAEGLRIAKQLQLGLARVAKCRIWTQGVFGLTQGTLDSLIEATKKADFAILVLTPDDLALKRGSKKTVPRDNVVFELGLFMGALGRKRTFIVHNRDEPIELPSNLAGITTATFSVDDDDLQVALGEVCTLLEEALREVGAQRDGEQPGAMADLLGRWRCAWFVGDRSKPPAGIRDNVVLKRISGETVLASGTNPKFGNYDLLGRITPAGVLTFYYKGDMRRNFSGGVVILKVKANSRREMDGYWYEYDADRQFYGGETSWKRVGK